jgi:dolichol-phosphate mannosyltransferase
MDRLESEGYSLLVEMLYLARQAGCRIVESPIIFVERRQGISKMSSRVMLESALTPWRLLVRR